MHANPVGFSYAKARGSVISIGSARSSTCWTTRASCFADLPCPPQSGHEPSRVRVHAVYVCDAVKASGENGGRSCFLCPGGPPIFRWPVAPGGVGRGGLTISLDGGFDDVAEFFRALASAISSSPMRRSNSAFRAS